MLVNAEEKEQNLKSIFLPSITTIYLLHTVTIVKNFLYFYFQYRNRARKVYAHNVLDSI